MTRAEARLRLPTVIPLLFVLAAIGIAFSSHGEETSFEQLVREGKYVEAIRSLEEVWRANGKLSPEDMKTYLEAYYLHGDSLLKKGDVTNARACLLRVISLDRGHADACFQLGILEKRAKNYQKALPYLRSAISLASQHSPEANAAIIEIGQECLSAGEGAIGEGNVQTARSYLNFVSANFPGEEKNRAIELMTYRLTPLSQAADQYAKATQLLSVRNRSDALRILRGIPRAYPDTFFARKANQLLEELGERIVVPRTSTGLELPVTWKRKETANFEVYYEKEIFFNRVIPRAEEALPRIFASFGYQKPNWKNKCKVYLFSSLSDWRKFHEANPGRTPEWSDAFSIPEAMEIYLYELRDTSLMVDDILPHELTHIVHSSVVGRFVYTPRWLSEGLAYRHQKGKPEEVRRQLRLLTRNPLYIPLRELVSLPDYPDRARTNMFYLESAALVDLLLEKYGPTKIREIAFAHREPAVSEAVLTKVLGITVDDLEKLWKRYVE